MHISEGVLSLPILAAGGIVTFAGTAVGLKKLDCDKVMNVSLLTATFFVASLIHVPLGPGSILHTGHAYFFCDGRAKIRPQSSRLPVFLLPYS